MTTPGSVPCEICRDPDGEPMWATTIQIASSTAGATLHSGTALVPISLCPSCAAHIRTTGGGTLYREITKSRILDAHRLGAIPPPTP